MLRKEMNFTRDAKNVEEHFLPAMQTSWACAQSILHKHTGNKVSIDGRLMTFLKFYYDFTKNDIILVFLKHGWAWKSIYEISIRDLKNHVVTVEEYAE